MSPSAQHPKREALVALLERYGWRRERVFEDAERWLTPQEAPPATLLVPASEDVLDYGEVVERVIARVASAAAADRDSIAVELGAPRSDILRLALESEDATLPLRRSPTVYRATQDLITAALRSAESPRQLYGGRTSVAVARIVDSLRVTALSMGSFSITVEAPLPDSAPELAPLSRRGFARLAAVCTVLGEPDVDLTEPSMVQRGASANLYRAAATLMDAPEPRALRLEFSWSPAVPPPEAAPTQIVIPAEQRRALVEAAQALSASASGQLSGALLRARRPILFQIFRDERGAYRWRIRGASGAVLATSSEAYDSSARARAAVSDLRHDLIDSTVEEEA